ncbi:MAG: tRNA epoxyqueuosine(34) reductase QueG [Gemmataceae bacterium]
MTLEAGLLDEARRLGFELAGIASAEPADGFARMRAWLDAGHAGEMGYLHDQAEARRDPRAVYPEVRAVVMVGMNYFAGGPAGGVARYARGPDYHLVVRERLKLLGGWLKGRVPGCWGRVCVDTAPLLERDFARRAGLGWFGKNTMLIDKRMGSWFVLGGMLVDLPLTPTAPFEASHCGTCTRCLDACPTGAFAGPFVLDARKCISYWTIELKRPLDEAMRTGVGDWLYGCDVCQEVCPWNRRVPLATVLTPRPDLERVDAAELLGLDAAAFRARFAGTALFPRPGRAVVLRNAALVLGNGGDAAALPALRRAMADGEPMIADAASWAVGRIERPGERG